MKSARRVATTLMSSFVLANSLHADLFLFDERTDKQEITEVRYTVPSGCVITGLGLRAHYDNITTMHCRYHRLGPDGKLVSPSEVHLGAEPDHECEAKVLLPEGWVAVGFGAAGEPEWDVTLVRIWGRKLDPDGTLGEIRAFSDGFKPDRGPEREILLTEPDRVLCAAGARFGANDILGLYAQSRRVIRLDETTLAGLRPLRQRAWVVDGVTPRRPDLLADDLERMKVGRLDINIGAVPNLVQVHAVNALATVCDKKAVQTYLWIGIADANTARKALEQCPSLDGLVLDLASAESWTRESLDSMHTVCRELNRSFSLRFDPSDAMHLRLASAMPVNVSALFLAKQLSTNRLAGLGARDTLVEIDLSNLPSALAELPDIHLHHLAGRLADAQLAGANGFVVHVHSQGVYIGDTVNGLALEGLCQLSEDPFQIVEPVLSGLCRSFYGDAGTYARSALEQATFAGSLVFGALDVRFLWQEEGIARVDVARARLSEWLADASAGRRADSIRQLLAPTKQVLERAHLEEETAQWLLRQSIASAAQAADANPSARTHLLCMAVERTKTVTSFFRAAIRAFLLTQMYAQDVAPATRQETEATLERLPGLAAQADRALGDSPIWKGLDEFIASARLALKQAEENAPLAVAFRQASDLVAQGKHEKATRQLYDMLNSEVFAPHLDKNKRRIEEITSLLTTLWKCPDNLRSLRGGDGQWTLTKKDDRWAWSTTQRYPCIYFDVQLGPLEEPTDYLLDFEYFDEGNARILIHYDSDYPGGLSERQYHAAEPVELADAKTWKTATRRLTKCRFGNGQNESADLRFVGRQIHVRSIALAPVEQLYRTGSP